MIGYIESLINGILMGSIYGLTAVGLTLIFRGDEGGKLCSRFNPHGGDVRCILVYYADRVKPLSGACCCGSSALFLRLLYAENHH